MSKFKTLLAVTVLVAFGATAAFADRPNDRDKRDMQKQEKLVRMEKAGKRTAHSVLKRTTAVIVSAQKAVKRHHNFTGDLSKAYQHQKFAKMLFARGDYDASVRQSLRARQLAYQAMEGNRTRPHQDYDRDERRFRQDMRDNDLDRDEQKYRQEMRDDDQKRDSDDANKDRPRRDFKDDDVIKLNINAEFGL